MGDVGEGVILHVGGVHVFLCEYGLEVSVEYMCFVFWGCLESVTVVFEGSYGGGVLSARLKEFVEMFFVISNVVC